MKSNKVIGRLIKMTASLCGEGSQLIQALIASGLADENRAFEFFDAMPW